MPVNAYSPEGVVLTLAGIIITGFGPADFLVIARPEDEVTMERGTHGEQTFNQRLIRDATATLTMHAGSRANDDIQALLDIQRETGSASFPFSLTDIGSTDRRSFSPNAKIQKTPDMTLGATVGTLEWVFLLADCDIKHTGRVFLT